MIVYTSQAAAEPAFARMAAITRDQLGALVVDMQRSAGELIADEDGAPTASADQ